MKSNSVPALAVVTGALSYLCASAADAQIDYEADLRSGTPAIPIERKAPRFPAVELRRGRQGWVQVSYVVTTEGKVVDPVIVDSSGSRSFEKAALRSVRDWKFEPATWNGEVIEQCDNDTMINFSMNPTPIGTSRSFVRKYSEIAALIDDDQLNDAESAIKQMFDESALTVYEVAWLWMIRGRLAAAEDNPAMQLVALKRAAANNGKWIEEDLYENLLATITALELQEGKLSSALSNYDKLVERNADVDNMEDISAVVQTVRDKVASSQLLYVDAKLAPERQCEDCLADWQYKPLRKKFSFEDIEGSLEKLEIRCTRKRIVDRAREGVSWNLSDDWGVCRIIVFGDEGATFKLLEEPASI